MAKSAWDTFHVELDLRGQQSTVVEDLGGVVSKSLTSKTWSNGHTHELTDLMFDECLFYFSNIFPSVRHIS